MIFTESLFLRNSRLSLLESLHLTIHIVTMTFHDRYMNTHL
jgi:hypothetical protein